MPLMLAPASHCTRISFTSATRILLRPIDHLRLRCGHGRGHLLRTGRWQIVVNSYLVNSDEQNRPYSGKLRRTATHGWHPAGLQPTHRDFKGFRYSRALLGAFEGPRLARTPVVT